MVIILHSERLIFRPHERADLDAFCAMEMDANVRRFVGGYPRSREAAEQKFPRDQLQEVPGRLGVWATVLKSTGKYVGRCGLYPHFNADGRTIANEATLSFYIAHAHWGQGFASEAGAAFVEFGWKQLRLARIVATVQAGNVVSSHILEKLGFTLISTEVGARSFHHFALNAPQNQETQP